jgi:hypothetical protein
VELELNLRYKEASFLSPHSSHKNHLSLIGVFFF